MHEAIDRGRRLVLAGSLASAGGAGLWPSSSAQAQSGGRSLPSLGGATGWLNSPPITADSLRGKVVLIDIWTYTCINWLRTLPYVRAWSEKYKNQGLVVLGVHSPEFGFEKTVDNVRRAAMNMRVNYPIAIDSDFEVWRALRNNAWPCRYFVDATGLIRHVQVGEGEYAQGEMIIKQLLAEAGAGDIDRGLVSVDAEGAEAPADWRNLRSPETYLGYEQTANFSSGRVLPDKRGTFTVPKRLALNNWALSGEWTFGKQFVALNGPTGRIAYSFHARDLHLVMGPDKPGAAVPFRVSIDGRPPRADRGVDIDEGGSGRLVDQRLYQLIRQQPPIRERLFEIEFSAAGTEAYCFTFG